MERASHHADAAPVPPVPEQQIVTLEEMLPHLKAGGVCFHQRVLSSPATPLQSDVHSIHFYPYVIVIEKRPAPLASFSAPKHGTSQQPFRTSVG